MPRAWSHEPDRASLETILELGEGGMGKAYLARAVGAGGFHRLVVIKRLNLQLLAVPDAVERFLAEARIAARIHHANVIGTQQIARDAAGPFIVLDYIEGGSFDDLVSTQELPTPVILRIALDALHGLRAVHEARDVDGRPLAILHRDISLQNILVSALDGISRISDFGVAKSTLGRVRTEEGVFVGKLPYYPPEYLRREPVGVPLDIYALGVTLWFALTRRDLWEDADDAQVMRAILEEGIPPLREYVDVAPQVEELVMRACNRDPQLRFQSAREMAGVLERFDREHGWLASHAEVGALVEEILAPDLVYRRRRVSRFVHGEQSISSESQVELQPGSPPVSEARRRVASPPRAPPDAPTQPSANDPRLRTPAAVHRLGSKRSLAAAVLGIAAVVSLALLVFRIFRASPAAKPAEPLEITSAPANAQPTVPIVAPIESVPENSSTEVPPPSVTPPRRSERARQPAAPAAVSQPVHSSSLRKQNPYRRTPSANELQAAPAASSAGAAQVRR